MGETSSYVGSCVFASAVLDARKLEMIWSCSTSTGFEDRTVARVTIGSAKRSFAVIFLDLCASHEQSRFGVWE